MKKICFFLSAGNMKVSNGAFLELTDSLDKEKFKPYVILPFNAGIVSELEARNIDFRIIDYRWWMHERGESFKSRVKKSIINFLALPRVCRQIIKWQCDLIYTNTIVINMGLMSSIILRKPHIFHVHEFGFEDHGLKFDFGKRISLWFANVFTRNFIFVSNALADGYVNFITTRKSRVVYQSVALSKKTPANNNSKRYSLQCVIIGRITQGKGQEDAIEAISILLQQEVDCGLWIVGEGEAFYKEYLKKNIVRRNMQNNIIFCGWHENPLAFMKQADIVLVCSRQEAFGRVTVEAMLAGKPVIGSRSGGTKEIIKDE